MITRSKTLLTIVAVLAFSLIFFVGSALAQDDTGDAEGGWLPQMQQRMEERFGEGAWASMIAHMTERHGAEFTAERLQWMNENGCPMLNGEDGSVRPMMRHGQWRGETDETGESSPRYGRGLGMMGQGMMNGEFGVRGMMGRWMMERQGQ